ncbi:MAG: glycosyltransferase family 39 protein [Candidatus Omnitrophota bacterium]
MNSKKLPLFPSPFLLVLISVFLAAAFLQFFRLGERSLWDDEARIMTKLAFNLKWLLVYQKNIVFNVILTWWSYYGKSEFWLRIPSAFFAFSSLIALYALGKKLFSKETALLAVGLLAISPFFLLETRQVRMYSLTLFFSLASILFLMEYLETGRRGKLLSHIGVSFLALLTHYLYFTMLLLQVLWVLSFRQKKPALVKRYFLGWLMLAPCALPAVPELFKRLGYAQWLYLHPATPETLAFPMGSLGKIAFVYYLFTAGPALYPWNYVWSVAGCLLPAVLLLRALAKPWPRPLVFTWLGFILPIFLSSSLRNAQPRYAFASLPFYALLLAIGLLRLRPRLRIFCLSGLILLNGYGLLNYFTGRQYLLMAYLEPYREIVQSVQKQLTPKDYFLYSQANDPFFYYFRVRSGETNRGRLLHWVDEMGNLRLKKWTEIERGMPPGTKRLWYVESPPGQYIEETPILDAERIYRENVAMRSWLDDHRVRLGRWVYLKDPEIRNKKKFFKKFYLEERIVVSLYELTPSR